MTYFVVTVVAAWLLGACFAAAHAVTNKRDPLSAVIWVLVSVGVPFLGAWLYWVAGINRMERKAWKRLRRSGEHLPTRQSLNARETFDQVAVAHLTGFRAIADQVTRLPLVSGNALRPLHNGEEVYPRMLAAIRAAERSITMSSYIFDWDDVGREFIEALGVAARRGVSVHVLLDGVGALGSLSRVGRELRKNGVQVTAFFPLKFPLGRLRLNLRNHRKMLVIDGLTGFSGGMNISAKHLLQGNTPNRIEDIHFEITGPVVTELQHAFADDWNFATANVLGGSSYFPEIDDTGAALCRGISSGPDEDFEKIYWIVLAAIADARESIWIATPYFIPTLPLIAVMSLAALRGVEVNLMLPEVVDYPFMRWAADAYLGQLLNHGVRVYRRPAHFVHTKLIIVDERWLLLGSANLDLRSFRLNFEFNVECYDTNLAGELSAWLQSLRATAQHVTMEEMAKRLQLCRLRDGLAKMCSPFL